MTEEKDLNEINEKEMPFLDHLEELRWRLIYSIIAVVAGAIVVFFFSKEVLDILIRPYQNVGNQPKLIYLEPAGGFMIYMEVAFFGGLIASLPFVFYQIWKFIAPGLYRRERKYILAIIVISTISFIIGMVFAYLVIIPFSLKFLLLGFQTDNLAPNLAINKYLSYVLTMIFVAGLVFELPLISFFLAKLGLISARFMREKRRYGIVIILTFAAILTPPDVASQMLLAVPMVLLYEISIWVVSMTTRAKQREEAAENPEPTPPTGKPPVASKSGPEKADDTQKTETAHATSSAENSDQPTSQNRPETDTYLGGIAMEEATGVKNSLSFYQNLDESELIQRIKQIKIAYSQQLVLLGHHYQQDAVINLVDFEGDSFKLAQFAAEQEQAKFIVFAGVKFMAESARILARSDQMVLHPDSTAGCPLADFADIGKVELAWKELVDIFGSEKIIPLTYMNSTSEIKAFCGQNRGAVCTSSNAHLAFRWGFEQSERIFFFPDENLGRNTATKLNIPENQIRVWDPEQENGGLIREEIEQTRLFLWKGHCHVHTAFKIEQVIRMRQEYPDAKIVVHPECSKEVVDQVDANGSTEFIIQYVKRAKKGQTIIIGTEINMVERLAQRYPNKTIIPLAQSACPDMSKINLQNLCWTLENLGKVNIVTLPDSIIEPAKLALDRMLQISHS
ncbi:quinolinate synthase NadA [candidate division KSB1 bacterium]|nr:quinolinate synthase NadA [candidate division KSB1 bacterium]